MSHIRIAINGFGRIGRAFFRVAFNDPDVQIVAVNDIAEPVVLGHLLKYDSVHLKYKHQIQAEENQIIIDQTAVQCFQEKDIANLPWKELGVDIVIEATGKYLSKESANLHILSGAKKVIISAPSTSEDIKFIVLGVNEDQLDSTDLIVSNASCTTNNAAPMIKIMHQHFGVKRCFITTVHSYTRDQNLHDGPHKKDLRRARAASQSIIPTTTGATKALHRIFPDIANNMGGAGIRVPVPDGSLTDITCTLEKSTTVEEINALFKSYAENQMSGILEYTEDPIVSVDVIGNSHSTIFDSGLTAVVGDNNKLVKIVGWYDNEMGYSNRLLELSKKMIS